VTHSPTLGVVAFRGLYSYLKLSLANSPQTAKEHLSRLLQESCAVATVVSCLLEDQQIIDRSSIDTLKKGVVPPFEPPLVATHPLHLAIPSPL
jgi:hypothetical protein